MDWLRPGLLFGLLGASLPLLIHLIGKKRRRAVDFAAVRFLERAAAKSSASLKLKSLLLLLARMLAVGFLAFLFSGPGTVSESGTQARTLVLLVDTSPSMSATRNGQTRLDLAREKLIKIVDEGSEADRFAVLTTEKAALTDPEPFVDKAEARRRLLTLATASRDGGIPAALDLALALLKPRGANFVVLATDMQKNGWRGAAAGARLGLSLSIVDVGLENGSNAWIEAAESAGGVTKVKPAAVGPSGKLSVSLIMEGGQTITSFPEKGGEAEFRPSAKGDPAPATIRVSPGGEISWDDEIRLVPSLAGAVRLLVVNGSPRSVAIADELHFVRSALSSGGRVSKNIETAEIRQADLTVERAAAFDVVILANPGPVPDELAAGLTRLVKDGLGLIVTAGDAWSPERQNDRLDRLTPAGLRDRAIVTAKDPSRPPFEEFAADSFKPPFTFGEAYDRSRPAKVTGYWLMDTAIEREGVVLARLANQLPLLVERQSGKGRLMLFATSLDRDWSDFCLRPEFVPFLERLVLHAAGRGAGSLKPIVLAGEKVASPFADAVELTPPGGVAAKWLPGMLAQADALGFYLVTRAGRTVGGFYCRVDPAESDLTRLAPEEVKALTDGLGLEVKPGVEGGRARRDLSAYAAAIVLAALAAEALLSARRRRKAEDIFAPGEGGK